MENPKVTKLFSSCDSKAHIFTIKACESGVLIYTTEGKGKHLKVINLHLDVPTTKAFIAELQNKLITND